jgi:hypothetical protein
VLNVPVLIRARGDADLSACADLVREVHSRDRYPRFLPDPDPEPAGRTGAGRSTVRRPVERALTEYVYLGPEARVP